MNKLLYVSALACALCLAPLAQAAVTPVGGSMTASAHAWAGSQGDVYDSQSMPTTQSGSVMAMAMSGDMGFPGDPMPGAMADAMADVWLGLRTDGFQVMATGHAGVMDGPGNSDASVMVDCMFTLDTLSSCAIVADCDWYGMMGSEAVSASLYLTDAYGQKLLELNQPMSHYEGVLELEAGQYSVVGAINSITIAAYSSPGMIWDGSGNFSIDLTATPVPEPMTLTLLAFGGLLIARKRS